MATANVSDILGVINEITTQVGAASPTKSAADAPATSSAMSGKPDDAEAVSTGEHAAANDASVAEGVGAPSVASTSVSSGNVTQPTPDSEPAVTGPDQSVPGGDPKDKPKDAPTTSVMNVDDAGAKNASARLRNLSDAGNTLLANIATQAKLAGTGAALKNKNTPPATPGSPAPAAAAKPAAPAAVAPKSATVDQRKQAFLNSVHARAIQSAEAVCAYMDGLRKLAAEGEGGEGGESGGGGGEGGGPPAAADPAAAAGAPAGGGGGEAGGDPLMVAAQVITQLLGAGVSPEELIMLIQELAGGGGGGGEPPAAAGGDPAAAAAPPAAASPAEAPMTVEASAKADALKREIAEKMAQLVVLQNENKK